LRTPSSSGTVLNKRFGEEGFRIALVARNAGRFQSFVEDLAAEGVEAEAFAAGLADRGSHQAVVAAITGRFGPIDVAVLDGPADFATFKQTAGVIAA
jgi:NAD(P)-dependent dehydrogenase (short-subunit alcohol dehydrogenase family)